MPRVFAGVIGRRWSPAVFGAIDLTRQNFASSAALIDGAAFCVLTNFPGRSGDPEERSARAVCFARARAFDRFRFVCGSEGPLCKSSRSTAKRLNALSFVNKTI